MLRSPLFLRLQGRPPLSLSLSLSILQRGCYVPPPQRPSFLLLPSAPRGILSSKPRRRRRLREERRGARLLGRGGPLLSGGLLYYLHTVLSPHSLCNTSSFVSLNFQLVGTMLDYRCDVICQKMSESSGAEVKKKDLDRNGNAFFPDRGYETGLW